MSGLLFSLGKTFIIINIYFGLTEAMNHLTEGEINLDIFVICAFIITPMHLDILIYFNNNFNFWLPW